MKFKLLDPFFLKAGCCNPEVLTRHRPGFPKSLDNQFWGFLAMAWVVLPNSWTINCDSFLQWHGWFPNFMDNQFWWLSCNGMGRLELPHNPQEVLADILPQLGSPQSRKMARHRQCSGRWLQRPGHCCDRRP